MADTATKKRKIDEEGETENTNTEYVAVQGPAEPPAPIQTTVASSDLPLPSERRETATLMLSTMSTNDLRELLVKTATDIDEVYRAIRSKASSDPASRKLFVRGLAFSTTIETMKEHFAQFGEIEEATIVTNKQNGQSRGYGFVTYKAIDAAHRAVKDPKKSIDGREVTCNLAAAGNNGHGGANTSGSAPAQQSRGGGSGGGHDDIALRKLFVRGLSWDTTTEALLHFFGQFGSIEEGGIVTDRNTQKSKGYGFVTYHSVDSAREALKQPSKYLDGRTVHVNLAEEGKRGKEPAQSQPSSGWNNQGTYGQQQQQWSGSWGGQPAPYQAYPMGGYSGYPGVQQPYSNFSNPAGYSHGYQPPVAGAPAAAPGASSSVPAANSSAHR